MKGFSHFNNKTRNLPSVDENYTLEGASSGHSEAEQLPHNIPKETDR